MAEDTYVVDQIIGRRVTSKGKEDYLVRWQSYSPLQSTWEPIHNFAGCQRAIREFYDKHWPIPGSQATSVVHVPEKPRPVKAKQELLTLQALPSQKGKKLLRVARKDLKEEILRLQLETKSSLENQVVSEVKPPVTSCNDLERSDMVRLNGALPKHSEKVETRKLGIKRKKDNVNVPSEIPEHSPGVSKRNRSRFVNSLEEVHQEPKKILQSPKKLLQSQKKILQSEAKVSRPKEGKPLLNGISPSGRKKLVTDDSSDDKIVVPVRLTRQRLPSCSATCMLEEELVVTNENGCMHVKLCNAARKNVISLQMCEDMINALHKAGKDEVSLVAISGSGGMFCYGWDLDQFENSPQATRKHLVQKYRLLTRMLITCPKPLIAAVNGPAAGFGLALLGLCDLVLASDQATFQANFAEWGHPPVGCCSRTLPHLLGTAKAMSTLLLNCKLSASAAEQGGLVSQVLESKHFDGRFKSITQKLLTVSSQCLKDTKSLLHERKVQELASVNVEETEFFLKYILNDITLNGILKRWRTSIEE